jgi:hypothetical protein
MDEFVMMPEASVTVESATSVEETPAAKLTRERDAKVLAIMRTRLRNCISAEEHYRTEAIDDSKFRAGTWGKKSFQWHAGIQEQRIADGRPCITVNKMPGFVRQVTNQARQANLRIQVSPVDDKGDPATAEVLQGIIHNIETTSFADRAYTMGSEKQAEQGRGYFRLLLEWADKFSGGATKAAFRLRIKIKREKNPLAIYVDPAAQEADSSDADWGLKATDIDTAVFEDLTGHKPPTPSAMESIEGAGDQTGDWFPNGKVRYVEYFSRETRGERKHVALMSSGEVIEYPDEAQKAVIEGLGDKIVLDRWVQKKVMVWRKCTATAIYEESVWPADAQPWIPVIGDELEVEGEKDFRGVVRDSKDSGRLYNVEVSALIENVGLGQKAPVVGYRGQFGAEGSPMRNAWKTANKKPHAFLEVEPMDLDGKPAPIPQRVPFETNVQGIVIALEQTNEDYKSTAGFRDASLGERGPQESGKAILARQKQDELGSSHYLDNLRFSLCAAGRQLIQLIRATYDVPTIIRILGKDERPKKVMVFSGADKDPRADKYLQNDPATGAKVPFQLPKGVSGIFDLGLGEYDIEVQASPSSGTRRQEAVEAMSALFQRLPPEIAAKFLDLYFLVMDFPMGRQLADRAKKMLPPEFQGEEEGGGADVPPAVQAELQQLKQQLTEMATAGKAIQQELETEQGKQAAQAQLKDKELASNERVKAAELASREKIEGMKQRAKFIEQQLEQKAERSLVLLEAELDHLRRQDEHQQALEHKDLEHAETVDARTADHAETVEARDADHAETVEARDAEDRRADADRAAAARKTDPA